MFSSVDQSNKFYISQGAAGYQYIRLPPNGVSTLSTHHGQDAHTACITSDPPPLDLNKYVYFNSKLGGVAANYVTVCESHGKAIN
jgi:hypothetical protein